MLLTADLHLTDNPADEYRWAIFEVLEREAKKRFPKGADIAILGDLNDRKDRHSAALVNRTVAALHNLAIDNNVTILMGNHDMPVNGVPYWHFLSTLCGERIRFVTQPYDAGYGRLFLPYTPIPKEAWKGITFSKYKVLFLHQTITGAVGNNGHTLENKDMPLLPRGLRMYAGDIHTPQIVNRVTYVGAPYPVAFGDDYPCRILQLDGSYDIAEAIPVSTIQKLMLRVDSIEALEGCKASAGDQARVVFKLSVNDIDLWPKLQDAVEIWAQQHGVKLASVEPDIESTSALSEPDLPTFSNDPEEALRSFAEAEQLDGRQLAAGLSLLREVL